MRYRNGRHWHLTPEGSGAISRWWSAATPPGRRPGPPLDPGGVAAPPSQGSWGEPLRPLRGRPPNALSATGGIAALNPRLIAPTLPGSNFRGYRCAQPPANRSDPLRGQQGVL